MYVLCRFVSAAVLVHVAESSGGRGRREARLEMNGKRLPGPRSSAGSLFLALILVARPGFAHL